MPIVAVNDAIFELAIKQLGVTEDSQAVSWHVERIRECLPNLPDRTLRYLADQLKHRKAHPDWWSDQTLTRLQDEIEKMLKEGNEA